MDTTKDSVMLSLHKWQVGQMLDGLQCREDAYRATAEYLEDGSLPSADFVIEDVASAQEARNLADTYAHIIASIRKQQGKE